MINALWIIAMNLLGLAIDLVSFFILVRFLRQWRVTRMLVSLDNLGSPILAEVVRYVEQARISLGSHVPLSTNQNLLVALIFLTMIRLFAFSFGVVIL